MMAAKPRKTSSVDASNKSRKMTEYVVTESPLDFYISEQTASYGKKKPFSIYYDDQEHSVRLLKGDSIEVLNQARENSVDRVLAVAPRFP